MPEVFAARVGATARAAWVVDGNDKRHPCESPGALAGLLRNHTGILG